MARNILFRLLSFFIFPALVFFFNIFINLVFDISKVYPWTDIPTHFIGGFAIAYTSYLFLRFFKEKKMIEIKSKVVLALIIVSLVCMVAISWEFYEFIFDKIFGTITQPSAQDTLTDLLMGFLGGVFGALIFRKNWYGQ